MIAQPSLLLWHFFGLDPDRLNAVERALLRGALGIGVCVLAWTFLDVHRFAGVDLRNRVVGARVMLAGHDPYTFVWQPGMPEEWLDPVHDPQAHRLTVSPPMLLPFAVVAPLPYRAQRVVSFMAEWLALLASLALLVRILPKQRQRVIFLLGGVLFFIATDVWRLHVERGQVYAFHLLALSVALHQSQRFVRPLSDRVEQRDSIGAGIALGLLALMRRNLLVFGPGLVILNQQRSAGAFLATVCLGVTATCAVIPTSAWRSYLYVGEQYYRAIQHPDAGPERPRPTSSIWAEGVNFDQQLRFGESSSFAVLLRTLHEQVGLPLPDLALASKVGLVLIAGAMVTLLILRRGDIRAGFALMIVLGLDTEFFLPHRWGYADIVLLAPLALLLPTLLAKPWGLAIVAVGLVGGLTGPLYVGFYVGTLLRAWGVMSGLTALALTRADPAGSLRSPAGLAQVLANRDRA